MGEDKGLEHYLAEVAAIETANQHRRVVSVSMPCPFPSTACNVEDLRQENGMRIAESVPNMRRGLMGSYRVTQGPFSVLFSDGTTA